MKIRALALPLVLAASPLMAQVMRPTDVAPMSWVEQLAPEKAPPLKMPEYANALDQAQIQMAAGRYRLALQTLRLAKDIDPVKRDLLSAEILYRSAYYTQALATLDAPALTTKPEATRLKAVCLAETGKRKEAIELLRQLATKDNSPQTHLALGDQLESTGQLTAARDAYKWFTTQNYVDGWNKDQLAGTESADDLIAIGAGLDGYARLAGLYREQPELHHAIIDMFVRASDVIDRHSADAHVASARFLIAHGNGPAAGQEIEQALAINPGCVDAWAMMGQQSIRQKSSAEMEQALNAIANVNPDHPAGTQLEVQFCLMLDLTDEAQRLLAPLIARDPDSADLQALLAACDAPRPDPAILKNRLAQIDAKMPESSLAYVQAAETLVSMSQPMAAIDLLKVAIERTPHWNQPRNLLGMVYMVTPNTDQARPYLQQAHDLDPFSVETTNYLRLLDRLGTFKTKTTEHFAVRFEPRDGFLADEIITYLEGNYQRIWSNFCHDPPERTFIELMPDTEDFAVRASGRPEHATYAVTMGPLITIIAPTNGGNTIGNFDWADVLRHEFTHTITLGATQGRIPRWFTEGLAVSEQVQPIWPSRGEALAKAVNSGKLLTLRNLDLAITGHGQPELGYVEGYWICHYITGKYGYDKVIALMGAYHNGLTTDAAFRKVLGKSANDFDAEFAKWSADEIRKMGMDRASQGIVSALKADGEKQLKEQDYPAALDTFNKALKICPSDPAIHQRLAGLYLHKSINKPQEAVAHLQALDRDQLKDNRYALRLAKLYAQLGQPNDAIRYGIRATQINAYDPAAREALAGILQDAGRSEEADKQIEISAEVMAAKRP